LKNFTYVKDTPTRGTFTPRHGSVMHITAEERARLEAWSDLNLAMLRLRSLPSPIFSLKEIEQRKVLLEKAQTTLDTQSKAKAFKTVQKKIEKMIRSKE
jgi:hypothetical protein